MMMMMMMMMLACDDATASTAALVVASRCRCRRCRRVMAQVQAMAAQSVFMPGQTMPCLVEQESK
jgi:hypothetical protein